MHVRVRRAVRTSRPRVPSTKRGRHWHDEDHSTTLAGWRTVRLRGRAFDRRHRARAGRLHGARPIHGARRRDLLSRRLVPAGHGNPRRRSASTASPAPSLDTSAQPSTCVTPDPFAALGGGTCYRGGWFPPGMAIPGGGARQQLPRRRRRRCFSAVVDMRHAGSVRGARRRDLLSRRLVPAGHGNPRWRQRVTSFPGAAAACTSAVVDMRHAGSVRGARRRDLLSRRLVPAGHADPGRPRCDLAQRASPPL